jgi:AbrB family looped-hinge helix DNA binding protein
MTPNKDRHDAFLRGLRKYLNYKKEACAAFNWDNMVEKEVKVGKNGQIVIPKAMRQALKIQPGSTLTLKIEQGKIIIKPFFDAVAVFKRVTQAIACNEEIDPHEAYDEEMKERQKRAGL